jgi:hypothetical protein
MIGQNVMQKLNPSGLGQSRPTSQKVVYISEVDLQTIRLRYTVIFLLND